MQGTSESLNKSWEALQPWTSLGLLKSNCAAMATEFDPTLNRISSIKPNGTLGDCPTKHGFLSCQEHWLEKETKGNPLPAGKHSFLNFSQKGKKSFFKPVSLVFAWGFPCFLFYLNRVCQSEGQVLNMSMARTARAFYSLYPWGEDGTHASCLSEIYTQAGDFWPEQVTSVQSCGAVYETLGRSAKGQWNWSIAGDTAENIHSYSVLLCHLFISSHMAAMSRASDFFV